MDSTQAASKSSPRVGSSWEQEEEMPSIACRYSSSTGHKPTRPFKEPETMNLAGE